MNKQIVHSVFEQVAVMDANHTAVVQSNDSITYGALNVAANTLGNVLLELGLQKGDMAMVCMESSIEYIASILAISKAGGVFVPIEIDVPVMRLLDVVRLITPRILVTRHEDAQVLIQNLTEVKFPIDQINILAVKVQHGSLSVELLSDANRFVEVKVARGARNLNLAATGEDSCYLLFTSGSTGTPKAIEGRHKSLSHFIHWEIQEFSLKQPRVSQFAPVSFDVSLRDIFVPLMSGGTLYIPPKEYKFQIERLVQWIIASRIDVIHLVPTLFRLVTEVLGDMPQAVQGLKCVQVMLLAGEPLYGKDVLAWRHHMGNDTQLVNVYGPSETTLAKLFYRIPHGPLEPSLTIPLGSPISNTAVLILRNDQLCQIGQTGEIHIKTPFTTKGYFNNPALTAEKFIQNPLHNDYKDILYKTGDLGQYRADRTVAFMGRMDSQLKIRGNRVELQDIESALASLPAIGHAVVIARQSADMDYDLVCYYTGLPGKPAEVEAVKAHLSRHLPSYMVPAYYLQLERFPTNENGKIDRLALKAMEIPVHAAQQVRTQPTTETQKALNRIWTEVLKLENPGIDDSFFSLGGSSLKAIQTLSKVYKSFGILFKLPDLFRHATIRELAQLIDSMRSMPYQGISPVTEREYYPVSHAQRRLWVLSHFQHQQAAYNIPKAYLLEGPLNDKALHQALQAMTTRHESLRTRFLAIDGEPQQTCLPPANVSCVPHEVDLRGDRHGMATARQILMEDIMQPFDLATAPLLRTKLIRLDDKRYIFFFNIHHIIADGRSVELFIKELLTLYAAFMAGKNSPLSPLKIQYKDFSAWHNGLLQDKAMLLQKQYWLDKLKGELPVLDLPVDYTNLSEPTYLGGIVTRRIDAGILERLKRLVGQTGATLYMGLVAAVKVLLSRHTGQLDLIIGSPISGRETVELENQIGVYINMLALRTLLDASDTYLDILEKVKKTTLEAYENQRYPFDKLVDELKLERHTHQTPLFNVVLTLEHESDAYGANSHSDLAYAGMKVNEFAINEVSSKYDLDFSFRETHAGLIIHLHYRTDLFSKDRIERMARQLESLLDVLTNAGQEPVLKLDYLPVEEKQIVLQRFNDTESYFEDGDQTLGDLFEAQVARTPDAIAVVYGNTKLSYASLNASAGRIARWLVDTYNIGVGDLVGIMADHSDKSAVALLGILKAGAAFVPINPDNPAERVRYIVSEAKMRVILVDAACKIKTELKELTGVATAAFDELDWNDSPVPAVQRTSRPADLAYVIYTSGSTGFPKGVEVELRSVTNYLIWANKYYFDNGRGFNFGVFTPLSFDLTITGIFSTLLRGDILYLYHAGSIHDTLLTVFAPGSDVSAVKLTPSHITLLGHLPLKDTRVSHVIVGGEALTGEQVKTLRQLNEHIQIYNEYGPTETTVGCTVLKVNQPQPSIPIGSPIANTQIYILNEQRQPQPIGVYGEIFIGGAGLARGYLNQERLTMEKFVANPFAAGRKLYRTGDRGRWLPDGTLEFSGRFDEQLKVRGYRIEPAEVELALDQYPAIRQAVVIGHVNRGMMSLVAYFIAIETVPDKTLRSFLTTLLPDYMIPQFLIQLNELPLTNNGKINKALLPAVDTAQPSVSVTNESPVNELEQRLLDLWQEVLGNPSIDSTDNFFQIGGNSIRAIQVVTRLQENFRISVNDLYNFQTVRALAANIVYSKGHLKKNARALLKKIRSHVKSSLPGRGKTTSSGSPRLQSEYEQRVQTYAGIDLQTKNNFEYFFLTGATGYLGIHLLKIILENTSARVSVLVRSKSRDAARERLMDKLNFYFGTAIQAEAINRVSVYNGDLTDEYLGLNPEDYQDLAHHADCVIHCAANVKHYGSYEDFKAINLSAVDHLVKFCAVGVPKPLQHISTMSVFSGKSAAGVPATFSEFDSDIGQVSDNYYIQTKLEAEKLLVASRTQGLRCNIFRVGNLTFDTANGRFQENIKDNAFYSLLKSYVELKYFPEVGAFEFSHVDEVADAIFRLIEVKNLVNETYHIHNPLTVASGELTGHLHALGYEVSLLDAEAFVKYLVKYKGSKVDLIDNILLRFNFFDAADAAVPVRISSYKTLHLLKRLGFEWTPIKKAHIRRMMEHCIAVNFLEVQPVTVPGHENE